MIHQDDPKFEANVAYLVKMVRRIRGNAEYIIRAEDWDHETSIVTADYSEWITCMSCGKQIDRKHDCKWVQTKYMSYFDTVTNTPCCGADFSDPIFCPIVCVGCERIALFLRAHKNDTGFQYIKGRPYHIDRCNNCDGRRVMESLILEQLVHDRLNLNKTEHLNLED